MNSRRRVPQMEDVKVTRMINGPEAFTPDNEFCLGETEIGGLFVAAGFCAHGLAGAGGIGKAMAEWIAAGEPSLDLWHMDVRRFGAQYRSPAYTLKRIRETYETYYDIRYPGHEREAGRPLRMSPANAWHREHGAAFGEKSGWERVNWYESNAARGRRVAAPARLGRAALVAGDRRRARAPAGRRWRSSTSPRSRSSRSPGRAPPSCSSACATTGWRARSGRITYTQMLNSRGGIECDFTVARLARGALLDRDRHRVRQPRPRVDPAPPARRRLGPGARRDLGLGLLRDLGAARAGRARAAHAAVAVATRTSPT